MAHRGYAMGFAQLGQGRQMPAMGMMMRPLALTVTDPSREQVVAAQHAGQLDVVK